MTYQVRDITGRKLLERESADEVRFWLLKRPTLNYEVWILSAMPGDIEGIFTATEFLKHQLHKDTL